MHNFSGRQQQTSSFLPSFLPSFHYSQGRRSQGALHSKRPLPPAHPPFLVLQTDRPTDRTNVRRLTTTRQKQQTARRPCVRANVFSKYSCHFSAIPQVCHLLTYITIACMVHVVKVLCLRSVEHKCVLKDLRNLCQVSNQTSKCPRSAFGHHLSGSVLLLVMSCISLVLFWNLLYRIGLLRFSRISLDRFRE
jgi:hypothetical protein